MRREEGEGERVGGLEGVETDCGWQSVYSEVRDCDGPEGEERMA